MVIQLPGDVLFDSGKDSLKPDGKKILKQVADIIKNDATLSQRDFQVAGHTDKEPYAGPVHRQLGAEPHARAHGARVPHLAGQGAGRARHPDGRRARPGPLRGGRLRRRWTRRRAASTTQTREEEQKNRRVELVLQPDVAEMLNLKELTGG